MAGWEELDALDIGGSANHSKNDETNRLMLRVLGSEEGQRLLAWWREQLLEQPVAVPGSSPDFAFFREGQNSVIRDIEARIKRARNL